MTRSSLRGLWVLGLVCVGASCMRPSDPWRHRTAEPSDPAGGDAQAVEAMAAPVSDGHSFPPATVAAEDNTAAERTPPVVEVTEEVLGAALAAEEVAWVRWALEEAGAPGEFTLPGGQSALGWAILRGEGALARELLEAGADPNRPLTTPVAEDLLPEDSPEEWLYYLRRERKVTPLMAAAAMGQEAVVEVLLGAGADRWAQTGRHKTTAIWLAGRWQHVGIVQMLLEVPHRDEQQEWQVVIDLSEQRVVLENKGEAVLTSPVSTGRRGFETPAGNYVVTNKHRDWKSTLYDDAPMPYFLRLNCGAMGLHAGQLPGYPASHGCIRMPPDKARALFAKVPVGTRVTIQP